METLQQLKRRATDLIQSLPAMPAMPSLGHDTAAHSMKGTWEKISVPPLPRSSHSVDVVNGTAYIFGGEIAPRQPVDNAMHAVTLPFSSAPADYYAIEAKAAKPDNNNNGHSRRQPPVATKAEDLTDVSLSADTDANTDKGKQPAAAAAALGDVPTARVGHATAVIGHRIFLFGGRGGPDMAALDEGGRVWVFDTRTHLWSHLDPAPGTTATLPPTRSYHAAAATDKPNDFDFSNSSAIPASTTNTNTNTHTTSSNDGNTIRPLQRTRTWQEWAAGDADEVGTVQNPVVGAIAERATDADASGYGTLIVHGGCLTDGSRGADVWAFDVRSRVWRRLPDAPGASRGGTALAVASGGRLFRFGGFNGAGEEGGRLDVLHLVVETFDDRASAGEVAVGAARDGWQSIVPAHPSTTTTDEAQKPLQNDDNEDNEDAWPGPRSVAGLEAVTLAGREYLVLLLGERDPSNAGHAAAGKFWDDAWAFRVPEPALSATSLTDRALAAVPVLGSSKRYHRGGEEGHWARLSMAPFDDEDDASADGPGARGWIATSRVGELEESGVFVWGGLNGANQRLGDGWIFRLA